MMKSETLSLQRRMILAAVGTSALGALWLLPIGELLIRPLETRFPAEHLPPARSIDGIIALGGDDERINAAAELARLYPAARVVVTGEDPEKSRNIVLGHGVAEGRLTLEPYASNTFENATFTAALLKPRASQQWLLVTSPAHMPRAVGCFRKAGFNVLAWPISRARWTDRMALREWAGLFVYRILGRTDASFPAPSDAARS
jgi:uncharacterized SAM-binding protein YcdF (DUF218 family)